MQSKQQLKPRFNDHAKLNDVLRDDWIKAIELSHDSFQALLYHPVATLLSEDEDGEYEQSIVETVDTNQQQLSYADPIVVSILDNPSDTASIVMDSGEGAVDNIEQPMVLRIGSHSVPVGSVLEWEEFTGRGDEVRRVWWYVHSQVALGTTATAVLHNVIPCRDFDFNNDQVVIEGEYERV